MACLLGADLARRKGVLARTVLSSVPVPQRVGRFSPSRRDGGMPWSRLGQARPAKVRVRSPIHAEYVEPRPMNWGVNLVFVGAIHRRGWVGQHGVARDDGEAIPRVGSQGARAPAVAGSDRRPR